MAQSDMNTVEETSNDTSIPQRGFRNPLDILIERSARRFGSRSKEVERFLRFAFVGLSGAVIDLGLVYALQATILPPNPESGNTFDINVALATAIAFSTAVLSNFIWTRLWVYPDSRSRSFRRQFAMFSFISVVGGVSRTLWVTFTHSAIGVFALPLALPFIEVFRPGYIPGPVASEKLGTIVSQMIAMVVVMLWNFFANRYWTYNDVE